MLEELSKEELLDLIDAYDRYIQNANDEDRYPDGWYPVCIHEFYDCEYLYENEPEETEPEL